MRRAWFAALGLLAACAYYNTMWRAEQFAKEARRLEARGRAAEAKAAWARATTRAETVLARHPRSRWADDALVLKGEGLVRSGDCAAATASLDAARRTVSAAALRERASLAAAECALVAGDPVAAARLVDEVVQSRDGDRRARAALLAGDAARARGDPARALEWYARSDLVPAGLARVRVLLELHRAPEVLDILRALGRRPVPEREWAALMDAVARAAGPETASLALDRVLTVARMPGGQRGRLLLADGDRLHGAGRAAAASARYRAATELVPDSVEGALARARLARARSAGASDTAALRLVLSELGDEHPETRALADLLRDVLGPHGHVPGAFRAAELARDSLAAPGIATFLFLDLARRHPESMFAPKALVAALAIDGSPRDSILQVLHAAYPTSPYTRALAGAAGPAYSVAEDSLGRALGLATAPYRVAVGAAVPPPVPGPRGPFLDVVFRGPAADSAVTAGVPGRERQRPSGRERIR